LPEASEIYLKDPENDGLIESSDDEDDQKDDPMDDTEEEEDEAMGDSSDSSDLDSDDDDVQTKIEKAQVRFEAFPPSSINGCKLALQLTNCRHASIYGIPL
jgi:hypothetical protein